MSDHAPFNAFFLPVTAQCSPSASTELTSRRHEADGMFMTLYGIAVVMCGPDRLRHRHKSPSPSQRPGVKTVMAVCANTPLVLRSVRAWRLRPVAVRSHPARSLAPAQPTGHHTPSLLEIRKGSYVFKCFSPAMSSPIFRVRPFFS